MIDYSNMLSDVLTDIKPSGIRKFFDLLSNMDDVTALTVGQPDFVTPWHIREAAIASLEEGKTYYTSNAGTVELREAISAYMSRRFSLKYDAKSEIFGRKFRTFRVGKQMLLPLHFPHSALSRSLYS